jgi:hypothetical protein
MLFSERVEAVLASFGVPPDTKAALYDLYIQMGEDTIAAFAELAETVGGPAQVRPEHMSRLRSLVAADYLRRNHALWLAGKPTPSFYLPRLWQGYASGFFSPLCQIGSESDAFASAVGGMAQKIAGSGQPVPAGILLLGKNSHYCGRDKTISCDVVCGCLDDALRVSACAGRHHTVPGSLGATSGSFDSTARLALIWEIQPHVYKPSAERNQDINKIYRRHRNWHITTLVAAIHWLTTRESTIFILRGEALRPTHELNKNEPMSDAIIALHEQTVRRVVSGMGLRLTEPLANAGERLAENGLVSGVLDSFIKEAGAAAALYRVET